ncbi:MAG TPA: YihY/virulence factor BrkB family protein [Thermoleophilia bacterium]|nr:YihY/virulence factor BrkB family protein [Thermoleophilia bacterium]
MAAALTYYVVLAIFPALIVVAGLLGAIGLSPEDVDVLLDAVAEVGPDWAVGLVQGALSGVLSAGGASIALGAGALLALWSASSYVSAFLWAAERMEGRRPRPFLRQLPTRLGLAVLLILLLTACGAAIVLAGPFATWLGDLLGIGDAVLEAWSWLKWPFLFGVALLALLLLYHTAARPGTRWRSQIVAAAAGVVIVLVASAGFSVYLTHFASYSRVYGVLATGIAFLVWAWLVNSMVLLGFLAMVALDRGARTKRDGAASGEQSTHG